MKAEDVKPGLVYVDAYVWLVLSVQGFNHEALTTYAHFTELALTGPRAGRARETTLTFTFAGDSRVVLAEGR